MGPALLVARQNHPLERVGTKDTPKADHQPYSSERGKGLHSHPTQRPDGQLVAGKNERHAPEGPKYHIVKALAVIQGDSSSTDSSNP